jgi:hypothetical protein
MEEKGYVEEKRALKFVFEKKESTDCLKARKAS